MRNGGTHRWARCAFVAAWLGSSLVACGTNKGSGAADPVGPDARVVRQLIAFGTDAEGDQAIEHGTGECMRGAGFRYVDETAATAGSGNQSLRPTREDAEQHGLGISIDPEVGGGELADDPNADEFSTLSAAGRQQWIREYDRCRTAAYDDHTKTLEGRLDALPAGLQEQIESLRFYAHPDLADAVDAWAECMGHDGWDYDHPLRILQVLSDEFDRIEGNADAIHQFQARERRIAVSNVECADAHLYEPFDELLARLEREAFEALGVVSAYDTTPDTT